VEFKRRRPSKLPRLQSTEIVCTELFILTGSIAGRTGKDLGRKTVSALRQAEPRQLTDASVIRLTQQAGRSPSRQVFALYLGMVGDPTAAKDLTHIRQNSSEVLDVQFERSFDRPASNARAY